MRAIVCWMWNGANLSGRQFLPAHVNTLGRMIARHMTEPYRFVCVTDDTKGFEAGVTVVKTPPEAVRVGLHKSPEGARFPSCYRRLWMFSEAAAELGERLLLIDIDLVVTGSLEPLFMRTEPFVGWQPFRDWGKKQRLGGGIYLLTAGAQSHVWTTFKGAPSIQRARAAGYRGSDQAWISYCLAGKVPVYARDSGIYSIRDFRTTPDNLPADARLVQFNGPVKPWQSQLSWVRRHYH